MNQGAFLRPGLWASRALVPIRGGARLDWHILSDLASRLGLDAAFSEDGLPLTPTGILDAMFAKTSYTGLTFAKLADEYPNGILYREGLEVGDFFAGVRTPDGGINLAARSEEHTSELQSLMRNSYAVFCLKKKTTHRTSNK